MNIKGEFSGVKWIGFIRERAGRRREYILKYREPDKEWKPVTAPKDVTSEVKFRSWVRTVLTDLVELGEAPAKGGSSSEARIRVRAEDWLELRRQNDDVAGATFQGNRTDLNKHIVPRWGDYTLTQLDGLLQELRAWVRELSRKLSPIRVSNIISTFRIFVRDSKLEGWTALRRNPIEADEVTTVMPTVEKKRDVVHMPLEVAQPLLDRTKDIRHAVRYAVALNTGAGDGELAGCVVGSVLAIDGESPRLEILQAFKKGTKEVGVRSKLGKTKNAYRVRAIPLNECAREAIKDWLEHGWEQWVGRSPEPTDPLFSDSQGNFSRPASSQWLTEDLESLDLPTVDAKGRKLEFRCLRRTFSTMLSIADVDREIREQLMGQSAGHVNTYHYTAQVPAKHFSAVRSLPLKWLKRGGKTGGALGGDESGGEDMRQKHGSGDWFRKASTAAEDSASGGKYRKNSSSLAGQESGKPARRGNATKEIEPGQQVGDESKLNQGPELQCATKNESAGGFRGVYRNTKTGQWEVKIAAGERRENGKRRQLYLGLFNDPAAAARVYDEAAVRLLGPSARLNFEEDRDELCAFVAAVAEHAERAEAAGVQ